MGISTTIKIIFSDRILIALFSLGVMGNSYADSLPLIQLSLKPRLCVLSEGEEVCRDTIEITWIAQKARSLCLYQDDTDSPLQCWDAAREGRYTIELAASENINFSLREKNEDTFLVTQAFEVVQESTKYRRRNRNPWSFF